MIETQTTLPRHLIKALEAMDADRGDKMTAGQCEALLSVTNWLSCTLHGQDGQNWGHATKTREALLTIFGEAFQYREDHQIKGSA